MEAVSHNAEHFVKYVDVEILEEVVGELLVHSDIGEQLGEALNAEFGHLWMSMFPGPDDCVDNDLQSLQLYLGQQVDKVLADHFDEFKERSPMVWVAFLIDGDHLQCLVEEVAENQLKARSLSLQLQYALHSQFDDLCFANIAMAADEVVENDIK